MRSPKNPRQSAESADCIEHCVLKGGELLVSHREGRTSFELHLHIKRHHYGQAAQPCGKRIFYGGAVVA